MIKYVLLTLIGIGACFYYWPKETEKNINKTVRTAVGTVSGAFNGATAELKKN